MYEKETPGDDRGDGKVEFRYEPVSPMRFAAAAVRVATCVATSFLLAGVASCSGCHVTPGAGSAGGGGGKAGPDSAEPTVRLYLMSDLAGALEPCGCTKDQLGGLDHAGAFIESEKKTAPRSALVTAGPTFYMEDDPHADHLAQDTAKANTIATSMKGLGFVAFAPGRNDWVGSVTELAHLEDASGGTALFANAAPGESIPRGVAATVVKDFGGTKVGFIGVSAPDKDTNAKPFPGLASTPAGEAVKKAYDELHGKGNRHRRRARGGRSRRGQAHRRSGPGADRGCSSDRPAAPAT